MLAAGDLGIGLPPTLLGADPDVTPQAQQVGCPSPREARLRVANLGHGSRVELIVVDPARERVALSWAGCASAGPAVDGLRRFHCVQTAQRRALYTPSASQPVGKCNMRR